ncbi:MAG: hypothetical protein ABIM99_03245 [Candidatus Dojkabacteria bacterium]
MEIYAELGLTISPEVVYKQTAKGDYLYGGNSGFRIFRPKEKLEWIWHFTPENYDAPPARADEEKRAKYRKMFVFGFYSILNWLKKEGAANNIKIIEFSSYSNKSMSNFILKTFGKDNVNIIDFDEAKQYISIYIDQIVEDQELMQLLKEKYLEVLNNPFKLDIYEND